MNPFSVPLRCRCISYKSWVYLSSPFFHIIIRRGRSLVSQTLGEDSSPTITRSRHICPNHIYADILCNFLLEPHSLLLPTLSCAFKSPSHLCTNQNRAQLFLLLSGVTEKICFHGFTNVWLCLSLTAVTLLCVKIMSKTLINF